MKRTLDCLAYKVESFDTEVFIKDLIQLWPNSLVLVFNRHGVRIGYQPPGSSEKENLFRFWRFGNPKLDYLFYPFFFVLDLLRLFHLVGFLCVRFRVKRLLVENTFLAALLSILRRLRLVDKMVYVPGDWLAGNKTQLGIWSKIGNDIVFPLFDYCACRFSDVTWNCTSLLSEKRKQWWKKNICPKEVISPYRLEVKTSQESLSGQRRKIIFLGKARPDSGIELVLRSLKIIRKSLDVTLKIVGPNEVEVDRLKALARQQEVEPYLEIAGFTQREMFGQILAEGFCGINLLTTENSYTSMTLPAKIFDYLQYLLPVIVTEHVGFVTADIDKFGLGRVIETTPDSLIEALTEIFEKQHEYRNRIFQYIVSQRVVPLREILE